MDVAHTSMIHAAAPHFLWPFVVQYAAHQLNLQPRVSMLETTLTLRWTGQVGDASAFRVWGSRAFVRDLSTDKLSSHAVPCVFLGFPPNAPGWQFYHPTSRRVLSSQDVTFDESVPYYRLFPYRTAPLPPRPLFLAPGPPPVDPLPPQGPAPSGVSQVDAVEPVEVAVDSGAARGAAPTGAGSGGAEPGGAGSGGAEPERVEPGGRESGGAEPGGAEPWGAESGDAEPESSEPARVEPGTAEPGSAEPGGPSGVLSRREPLSQQQLREWFAYRWSCAAGASGATGAGVPAAAGAAGGYGATGPGGARTGGTGAARPCGAAGARAAGGVAGAGAAGGAGAGATRAAGASGGPVGAGVAGGAGASGAAGAGAPGILELTLLELLVLVLVREMKLPLGVLVLSLLVLEALAQPRPYFVHSFSRFLRVCLPSPPASSLPALANPDSESLRAASPTVTCLLVTVVTHPSFESSATSALVAELVDFVAHCRLDYAASLVAESESVCPPSVGGECALSTDVLEDRQEEF
ncbi:unnamed protein product [Closterium sp. NIES-64]|nr:unnamed protein product [Closterium sp. NIES-64]